MPVLSSAKPAKPDAVPDPNAGGGDELRRILCLRVPLIVRLAHKRLPLAEVMRLGGGAILEFEKRSDLPLELLVNNKVIGEGEAVKVNENFGLRVTAVGDLRDKIHALVGDV